MSFVVGGRLIVSIYRIDVDGDDEGPYTLLEAWVTVGERLHGGFYRQAKGRDAGQGDLLHVAAVEVLKERYWQTYNRVRPDSSLD